jgi:peroxiredoxin Q/BCP
MDAYRDQYAKLFKGGKGVTLLAISTDPDTTLASWARDKGYPFVFLSDLGAEIGKKYGAFISTPRGALDNRTLFIVGPDGKIAHLMAPFREVDATAYTQLGEAIAKVTAKQ